MNVNIVKKYNYWTATFFICKRYDNFFIQKKLTEAVANNSISYIENTNIKNEVQNFDVVVDVVWNYVYDNPLNHSELLTQMMIFDNFSFHIDCIQKFFNKTDKAQIYLCITSSSVWKINWYQALYNATKTWLSNYIESLKHVLENEYKNKKIIEYRLWAFKSDIFGKNWWKISNDLYNSFPEPSFYAKEIVTIVKRNVFDSKQT